MTRARTGINRLAAAVAGIAAAAFAPCSHADDAQALFDRLAPSVVTVLAYDEAGAAAGQGSGVALGGGRIVSNCHVVRDAARLEVQAAQQRHAARWTRADSSRDLCVLEAEGFAGPPVRIRPLAGLAVGEPVHAIGNPLGFGLAVSSGLVTRLAEIDGERVILSSAAQSPGSSGGGLFDAQGRLVGISTGVLSAGQQLNIALPADWVAQLASRGIAPPAVPPLPEPEPRWVDEGFAMQEAGAWQRLQAHALAWRAAQPTAARASLFLAAALFNQDEVAQAEAALREALRQDDHMAHAWHYLGLVLHQAGRQAEAEQAMDRALALLPASSGVYLARGRWRLDAGQPAQALPLAERAVAIAPEEPQHWLLLGAVRQALGQPDEAIRAYRAGLSLNERDEAARNQLARLLAGRGQDAAAHRTLAEHAGRTTDARTLIAVGLADYDRQRYVPAEDAFRRAIAAAPDMAEGWEKLGHVLVKMQRDDEAAEALDRALQLDPNRVEARIERSNLHGRRGDLRAALADARRATELAPQEPRTWRGLAFHSTAAQDPRTAIAAYRRIDDMGRATVADLATLGDLLSRSGDASGALAVFTKAEALDPRDAGLMVNISAFHGRAGDRAKARQYIDRALAIDPRHAVALSSLGYLQLLGGTTDEAVKTLERAVAIDPSLSNSWINLGHAYLRARNAGRAIAALDKALALTPNAFDAHIYIAQAYLATRDGAKADAHAQKVLAKLPDMVPALGLALLGQLMDGRADEALATYRRLQARDPLAARRFREQAIGVGLAGAAGLPP
ncbi:tetratricopeptide repeat protein [Pseudorhodoferax sp.]|uniref:serine protease n=1 Tax=Pseudorhodoferax sp. TaxID=1993553 RepID=UPI0039E4F4B6